MSQTPHWTLRCPHEHTTLPRLWPAGCKCSPKTLLPGVGCPCSQFCARRKINNKQLRFLRTLYPRAGEMAQPEKALTAKPDGLSLIPGTQNGRRDSEGCSLTSTSAWWHTQTTVTYKRTVCPWEQVVEVPTGETGSRKISPGEKAQSLVELQLSASTSAASSRWVLGSLAFDVSLVCSLDWITPVASVGCWNFLV